MIHSFHIYRKIYKYITKYTEFNRLGSVENVSKWIKQTLHQTSAEYLTSFFLEPLADGLRLPAVLLPTATWSVMLPSAPVREYCIKSNPHTRNTRISKLRINNDTQQHSDCKHLIMWSNRIFFGLQLHIEFLASFHCLVRNHNKAKIDSSVTTVD